MLSLVTGSSGLLGRCLVEQLRERGDGIRRLDLVCPDEGDSSRASEYVRGDISEEGPLEDAARGVEVIYHLAAAQRMKPQFSGWSEEEIFETNLNGVRNVLGVAKRVGARRVVFTSSSAVYGIPRTLPCREDHPTRPLGAYGESKLSAEALCRDAMKQGLDVTVLRPMSLFGPYMSGVFTMLFEWVRRGQPVYLLGRGSNRVQAASAWDVADACILAAETTATSEQVFNLGSEPQTVPTVFETVRGLIEYAGTGSPILRIPAVAVRTAARVLRRFDKSPIVPEHYILADRNFVLDIEAAKSRLSWRPRYDNQQMMTDAYDWYVKAGPEVWQTVHPTVRFLNWLVAARLLPTRG